MNGPWRRQRQNGQSRADGHETAQAVEKMVEVCWKPQGHRGKDDLSLWPETGRGLDDDEEDELGSAEDLKTARRAEKKKFQFARRATSWDQLRISWTVRRTAREFHIASWAMKRDHCGISKTARRAVEAS
jgi:hypothetical protein